MAQFSIHENNHTRTRGEIPFLLDVQSDLLSTLATRMIVPLYRPEAVGAKAMTRLTPIVAFKGIPLIAMIPEMAGVRQRDLGPIVGDVPELWKEILQAIPLLITGF